MPDRPPLFIVVFAVGVSIIMLAAVLTMLDNRPKPIQPAIEGTIAPAPEATCE